MNEPKSDVKTDMNKTLSHLQTLRDEVRVRLHLAGMDAKDEWGKLDPLIAQVEGAAHEASEATQRAALDLVERLEKLRAKL
jgi:hypothetical protein